MNKKTAIYGVIAVVAIAVVTAFVIVRNQQPQQVQNPVSNGSETKYVIDMSSDVDTSDWPVFTHSKAGYSYKYHPSGNAGQDEISMGGPPSQSKFRSDYYSEKYGNFFVDDSVQHLNINSLSEFEKWANDVEKNRRYVAAKKRIEINNNPAVVTLYDLNTPFLKYGIYIFSVKNNVVATVGFDSEYSNQINDSNTNKAESVSIFKAMLNSLEF